MVGLLADTKELGMVDYLVVLMVGKKEVPMVALMVDLLA